MAKNDIFSSKRELTAIKRLLFNYARLPFFSRNIPGAVMEGVLAHVRGASVKHTYDFVDVVDLSSGVGWQIKSTLADTPVTWKRAKIPNRNKLISASEKSPAGRQELGNAIIQFCNEHALRSIKKFHLTQIGYARLVISKDGVVRYFERLLCTRDNPEIFNPEDFRWEWSKEKATRTKEQLPALHGTHIPTGEKWWAWHGRGENQLHFSGEHAWWPSEHDTHSISFKLPTEAEQLTTEGFIKLLDTVDKSSSKPKPA
jgi:hypothetical protein